MRLQRLTGLEREKIMRDYEETIREIERLRAILASEALVSQIIEQELLEVRRAYADARRTEIVAETHGAHHGGPDLRGGDGHHPYPPRLHQADPLSTYRSQRRGGKGLMGMETKEEDFVEQHIHGLYAMTTCSFSANLGRLYWLKVHQIPEAGGRRRGRPLSMCSRSRKESGSRRPSTSRISRTGSSS
ncbi:MAG: hypothetical protein MZV70_59220 [Desulfobacterales bacterium]|nr:hypothetical protein [Desulfobacterales bacterium]